MTESAVGAGAAARTSLGSAPMSDASVAAAVTPLLMKPRRSNLELINASSLVNPAVKLVSAFFMATLSSWQHLILTNELKLGTHDDGPKQIGETRGAWAVGVGRIAKRRHRHLTFRWRWRTAQQIPVDTVDRFRRCLQHRQRRHGGFGRGRRETIETRLLIEDEEAAGDAFALNQRLMFEERDAFEPDKSAAGNIVDKLGREFHAQRVSDGLFGIQRDDRRTVIAQVRNGNGPQRSKRRLGTIGRGEECM